MLGSSWAAAVLILSATVAGSPAAQNLHVRVAGDIYPWGLYDISTTSVGLQFAYPPEFSFLCEPAAVAFDGHVIAITVRAHAGAPSKPCEWSASARLGHLAAGDYTLDVRVVAQSGALMERREVAFEVARRGEKCNADPSLSALTLVLDPASVEAFLSGDAADSEWLAERGHLKLYPSYVDGAGYVRFPATFDPLADPYIIVDRIRASPHFVYVLYGSSAGCLGPCAGDTLASLVEYRSLQRDQYFYTHDPIEQDALDRGAISGWMRTGESMQVIRQSGRPWAIDDQYHPAYRFWGGSVAGIPSHFFTVSQEECAVLRDRTDWNWTYEGSPFWARETVEGACPVGAVLYRLYNNAADGAPAHRYTTRPAIVDEMSSRGWTNEGAAMCVAGP